jgi:hypothetical protein
MRERWRDLACAAVNYPLLGILIFGGSFRVWSPGAADKRCKVAILTVDSFRYYSEPFEHTS